MSTPPDLDARHLATLHAFILRARRVREHSLTTDRDQLLSWANVSVTVTAYSDGTHTLTRDLPPEEPLESLAARVRPILLQSDPVSRHKTLNALGYFLRGAGPDDLAALKSLRKDWEKVIPADGSVRGYSMQVVRPGDEEPRTVADSVLGLAWFYGDVVHADTERRAAAEGFSIEDRYEAAVGIVAGAAFMTIVTLNFIIGLINRGVLKNDPEVWEEAVTVPDSLTEPIQAHLYLAPEGTIAPEMGAEPTLDPPPGFVRFDGNLPEFDGTPPK